MVRVRVKIRVRVRVRVNNSGLETMSSSSARHVFVSYMKVNDKGLCALQKSSR